MIYSFFYVCYLTMEKYMMIVYMILNLILNTLMIVMGIFLQKLYFQKVKNTPMNMIRQIHFYLEKKN